MLKNLLPVAILTGALLAICRQPAVATDPQKMPDLQTVARAVHRCLGAADEEWRSSDLITRSQVRLALAELAKLGWRVSDGNKLLGRVLADDDPMAVRLRSDEGRPFMRRVAGLPRGYDRLDRLRRIPRGERILDDLVTGPGGDELIAYLTESPGGLEMGRMLGEVEHGAHFNEPTGRIYTERELLEALARSYRRDLAASSPGQ